MAIAASWVSYLTDSPFTPINKDLSMLDLGTYLAGEWGSSVGDVRRFLIGLRFQGCAAQNIKLWMDTAEADFYPLANDKAQLRQSFTSRGFSFRAVILDPDDPAYAYYVLHFETPVPDPGAELAWVGLPTDSTSALDLKSAALTPFYDAYSIKVGLAVQAGASELPEDIRNFRLMAAFDTWEG